MNLALKNTDMLARLPQVRGIYREQADLAHVSWFRVGGCADILFSPADEADLQTFLANCPEEIPVTVLGACSNTLVRDGGVPGVVIKLGRPFGDIIIGSDGQVDAGAAVPERGALHRGAVRPLHTLHRYSVILYSRASNEGSRGFRPPPG